MASPTTERARAHTASRRALKISMLVLATAIAMVIVAIFLRPSWIANALRHQVETVTTKTLGRPVSIGGISAQWFPKPGATLSDFRIEGEPGEPAIVDAKSASATVQLWPLIRSLGQDVRVDTVTLNQATLNLVRKADGSWNYEELGSKSESNRDVWLGLVRVNDGELHVTDQQAKGGTATVALRDIDLSLENVAPGQPLTIKGKAALTSKDQNVSLDLRVDPLPAKDTPKGSYPSLSGSFEVKNLHARAFRAFLPPNAAESVTGGILALNAKLSTDKSHHYAIVGAADASQLQLRGAPANASARFSTTVDPAKPETALLKLTNLAMKGPGVDLGGEASVRMKPMRAEFALSGPLLNLDTLLAALPQKPAEEKSAEEPLLPESLRQRLPELAVNGSLQLQQLVSGKLTATNLNAKAHLDKGILRIDQGTANLYGGQVALNGTEVDLSKPLPAWSLKARVDGMELGQAMASLSGHQAVQGKATGSLNLSGAGINWEQIRSQVTGAGLLEIADGTLTSADLGAQLAPALSTALAMAGQGKAAGTVERAAKGTQLKDLRTGFTIRDGFLALNKPITFRSDFGDASLDGRIGLDQRLDLHGKVSAAPQFVSQLTQGGLRPKEPIPIPIEIGGVLKQPSVKPGNPSQTAIGLLKSAPLPAPIEKEKEQLEEKAKSKAREQMNDVFRRLGK